LKKVLIITYYWPPSGGAGVQRWLKYIKYLRGFGWEPVVYTPSNPESPVEDLSLFKDIPAHLEVIKTPIWEPYSFYKKFVGRKRGEKINAGFLSEKKKAGLTEKISVWMRGNFFIPDARKFWIKPSVKFLSAYLKDHPVNAIVSTGPPHSMHLIALKLKQKFNLPWLADFRDPWTNIDFYDQLMLTKHADARHKKLEKQVLITADRIVIVSWSWAEDLRKLAPVRVDVVTNGYDEEDFQFPFTKPIEKKEFIICHLGSINKDRNPHCFWKAVKELTDLSDEFRSEIKIKLIGKNDISVTESIAACNLENIVEKIPYVPHDLAIHKLSAADVLLLPLNDTPNTAGVIPGKLFEYLASRKPIFAIGSEQGDSARIINETGSGIVCDFNNSEKIKNELNSFYNNFKTNKPWIFKTDVSNYSRKNCCKQIAHILNEIII
jgi:glycosyltransferase involved in cell wall biosynthesis